MINLARHAELGHLLRGDDTAQQRAELPLNRWAEMLAEYRETRLEVKPTMTEQLQKARKSLQKIVDRRAELEAQLEDVTAELAQRRQGMQEALIDGGELDELTSALVAVEIQQRELTAAIETCKTREAAAAEVVEALRQEALIEVAHEHVDNLKCHYPKVGAAVDNLRDALDGLAQLHDKVVTSSGAISRLPGANGNRPGAGNDELPLAKALLNVLRDEGAFFRFDRLVEGHEELFYEQS